MRPAGGMHPARTDASGCSDRCKSVAALWNCALAQVGARSKCVTQHLPRPTGMPGARSKCVTRARADRKKCSPAAFVFTRRNLHMTGVGSNCEQERATGKQEKIRSHSLDISCKNRKPQCYNAAAGVASACVARRAHKASLCDGPEDEEGAEVHEFERSPKRSK